MVGKQLEQVLVGGKVDHRTASVVFDHLGRAPVWGNQHTGDFVVLNGLYEVAVSKGARRVGRVGPIEEGRAYGDHHDHQKDIEPRIAPALFQEPCLK